MLSEVQYSCLVRDKGAKSQGMSSLLLTELLRLYILLASGRVGRSDRSVGAAVSGSVLTVRGEVGAAGEQNKESSGLQPSMLSMLQHDHKRRPSPLFGRGGRNTREAGDRTHRCPGHSRLTSNTPPDRCRIELLRSHRVLFFLHSRCKVA